MAAQNLDFSTSTEAMEKSTDTTDQPTPSDTPQEKQDEDTAGHDEPDYATGFRLSMIMSTLFLATLLAALDIGIVATAIPAISDEFHRLDDVGWYGSACFLLVGASSPMWGKLYKYLSARIVYLVSVLIFMVGSIVAAAAQNSPALIVGRALQGWGCAGTLGGSVLMISYVAEPKLRPMLIGSWMGVFMVSTIVGPLIGGAFTSEVTWRWCFWINLPVGGVVVAMVLFFFHVPKHIKPAPATWKEIVLQLDIPGFTLLLTSLICFTLALQWGGQSKPWGDGSVIATLVLWLVLTIAFVILQWLEGAYAMVPLRLLKPRLTWANALYGFITNLANFDMQFYLPIYFQSIHGQSAIASGVNAVPYIAFFAAGSVISGTLIGKTRLLQPYQIVAGLLATVGAALFYTMDINTSKARYIGPQVIFGIGIGLGSQIPMTTLQAFSTPEDIASTTSIMLSKSPKSISRDFLTFLTLCLVFQSIAGSYFLTASQSIFANRLLQTLASDSPNIDAAQVLGTGASDIQRVFSGDELASILDAYMVGMKDVFAFVIAGSALMVLLALVVPFKKMPSHEETEGKDATASA